ncbi:MAG TPA: ArsR family transcriptional regulator, partial [Steroidobacteraceae bacterium]|nr:ArsR family transcriptional regulator [Steroidobacteraceae bacterium]
MATPSITPAVADMLARGPAAAADMARALAVSQATLSRSLRALEAERRVLRIGSTHGARYARRRRLDAIGDVWPMYQIDEEGVPRELGPLHAIERESYFAGSVLTRLLGIFEGLPYYLQDTRPGGFLGRAVPAAYPELE